MSILPLSSGGNQVPRSGAWLPRLRRLNLKEGSGSLSKGKVGTPDVTITVTDKIFLQLGKLPVGRSTLAI